MSMKENPEFTPQAERKWARLGGRLQTQLVNNVWCRKCGETTTIVRFTGRMDGGDLVHKGRCIRGDSAVARVVEGN